MATEIGKILKRMNGYYNDLNNKQAEFMALDASAYLASVTSVTRFIGAVEP